MPEAINEAQRYIATMLNTLQNVSSAMDNYKFTEQQAEQIADNMDCLKLFTKNIASDVYQITSAAESKWEQRPATVRDECILRLQKTMYAILVLKNQFDDVDESIMDGEFTDEEYATFIKLLELAETRLQETTKETTGAMLRLLTK